ncbi:MAG: squalene/phytoene synthase family protein [Verrucomicrobia bacterium]|nr:squalene/phytoene synthase family protein [Verrucomicrobiota bacterium]
MSQAEQITKQSGSNLALAFFALPKETRRDITIFYAFCRRVDDAADETQLPLEQRREQLRNWRTWIQTPGQAEPELAADLRQIIDRYRIDLQLFHDILDGVEADLAPARYQNFEELAKYCYRVASAVGLVSIEIFGYRNKRTREYAYQLGMALQLTNIIRDVATDWANENRIYLPLDELKRFQYSEEDLGHHTYNERFLGLMRFQAERARGYFVRARQSLPREDRRSMIAAELMGGIYQALLHKIECDRFQMFHRRYRLSSAEKVWVLSRKLLANRLTSTKRRDGETAKRQQGETEQ